MRRADGQMVQLGPLMYALLEAIDGERDHAALADAMSERLGRRLEPEHVAALAEKLAEQGLLAGTEDKAPPRTNPLLALRWKVLVTDPKVTRPPHRAVHGALPPVAAAAGARRFRRRLLVRAGPQGRRVGHRAGVRQPRAAAARLRAGRRLGGLPRDRPRGGVPVRRRPPGRHGRRHLHRLARLLHRRHRRLPAAARRARLRTDLGGLYFNAVVAVVTLGVWYVVRVDALLLLIALQLLEMVKQLSPVIRADGYHILADATGVPDLYAHIGPTLKRLLPWRRREPSALTGRARLLVTAWVLVIVPILLSLSLSAILLFPKLAASTWESGSHIPSRPRRRRRPRRRSPALLRLFALALPVLGIALIAQRIVRRRSEGARPGARAARPPRRARRRDRRRRRPARLGLVAVRPVPAGPRERQRHARLRGAAVAPAAAGRAPARGPGAARSHCRPAATSRSR